MMKKGTPTGYYDKMTSPILVGDTIRVNGETYEISKYGSALHLPDKEAFPLSKMKSEDIEIIIPGETVAVEKTEAEPDQHLTIGYAQQMEGIPDLALAEELRRRGYDVKAKKVITIEL